MVKGTAAMVIANHILVNCKFSKTVSNIYSTIKAIPSCNSVSGSGVPSITMYIINTSSNVNVSIWQDKGTHNCIGIRFFILRHTNDTIFILIIMYRYVKTGGQLLGNHVALESSLHSLCACTLYTGNAHK